MIKDILKGLWKWVLWILILLLLFLIILAFRVFVIDKDYGKNKNGSQSQGSASGSATDTVDGSAKNGGSFGQKAVNGLKSIGNATVSGYKGDSEYDYNSVNFDEWFLMYEGEQYEGVVKNVLEHLIENSNGNFYARTSVTAVGFGENKTVSYEGDVTEYQNGIRSMLDDVTGGMYDISFKYAGIMTYVNEIVITKK
ncbi:MAG: hypothetical protein IJ867_02945 [Clostridia bacterium]|nr:hypothetical protein [Clostridia bacterium]